MVRAFSIVVALTLTTTASALPFEVPAGQLHRTKFAPIPGSAKIFASELNRAKRHGAADATRTEKGWFRSLFDALCRD